MDDLKWKSVKDKVDTLIDITTRIQNLDMDTEDAVEKVLHTQTQQQHLTQLIQEDLDGIPKEQWPQNILQGIHHCVEIESHVYEKLQGFHMKLGHELQKIKKMEQVNATYAHPYTTAHGVFIDKKTR